ncbi:Sporulation lipoprotein YhcN/YlaJ (Spore_YhcN_YlaJ) [Salinibacillus kushneri]|uniref:Sporulation lipoprotein YhcN/YlaJ (Spore_YhcN_YlaJ) n=1 Tax=Salinibacillus kushneri TaxID=237682 RepID=A0A1H9YAG8_9BACI|nr:YhcN/YlaJ family sporulation lipoprotein [Salinibacillus kushneri]SES65446.1 Sporulation lipoprotein YhcN/YlaJ (Spore_YhcN_YlaJ) [Salinibacillus kushneri]
MKKAILHSCLTIALLIIAGCGQQQGADNGTLKGKTPDNMNTRTSEKQQDTQYGYVRYNEKQLDMNREENFEPKIDREQMANMITKTLLKMPSVEEAATLITDNHTFIAYTPSEESEDTGNTTDQVKKTVMSFLPRWYNIYISTESRTYDELQSLSNNTTTEDGTNRAVQRLIDLIKEEDPEGGIHETENQITD